MVNGKWLMGSAMVNGDWLGMRPLWATNVTNRTRIPRSTATERRRYSTTACGAVDRATAARQGQGKQGGEEPRRGKITKRTQF